MVLRLLSVSEAVLTFKLKLRISDIKTMRLHAEVDKVRPSSMLSP